MREVCLIFDLLMMYFQYATGVSVRLDLFIKMDATFLDCFFLSLAYLKPSFILTSSPAYGSSSFVFVAVYR